MTIKQKIDKYLTDNYGDVLSETKVKGFRWQTIADKIGKNIDKDFVKDRWKVVKKKEATKNLIAVSNVIAEKVQIPFYEDFDISVSLEDTQKEVKGNNPTEFTITYSTDWQNPLKIKEKFNLIKWFKSLFK